MKRTILAALLLMLVAVPTLGQKMSKDDALKAALITHEKEAWAAWKSKNAEYFRTALADDAINNGRDGVETKDQIIKGIADNNCDIRSYSFDESSFAMRKIDDDAALLTYKAMQDYTCDGKAGPTPVWVSVVYVKRKGKWLNMLYQETQAEQ